MGSIITIISILGSLTSIYAFIHSIKLKDSIRNMVTYGILLLTSVISGQVLFLAFAFIYIINKRILKYNTRNKKKQFV